MAYQAEIEKLEARFREKPEQWFAALADAYRKAGDADMALEVLGAWIDKRPNYTSGHIVRGRCYLDKQLDAEAAGAFEHVLTLDMENVIALKSLSEIAERGGDETGARRWLNRLLEVDPMNEDAHAALEKMAEGVKEPAPAAEPEAAEVAEPEGFEPTAAVVDEVAAEADWDDEASVKPRFELDAAPPAEAEPIEQVEEMADEAQSEQAAAEAELAEIAEEAAGFEAAERRLEDTLPEPMEAIRLPEPKPEPVRQVEPEYVVEPEAAVAEPPTIEPAPAELSFGYRTDEKRVPTEERALPEAEFIEPPAPEPEPEATVAESPALEPEPEVAVLPLIVPEGVSAADESEREEAEAAGAEPEPVVTETMAELYAKQGLVDQARDIYRKLVAARPGDRRLAARLADLEAQAEGAPAKVEPALAERFAAASTGGKSVRELLDELLAPGAAVEAAPVAPVAPVADETVESAPAPQPSPPKGKAFSFDQFFGGGSNAGGAASAASEPPPSASAPKGPENEEFRDWLKGLKT